jgi:hypothetical protein
MDAIPRPEGLRGKRYIAYARCASKQGSTQSLRRQIRLVRQFGDRMRMRCVDEVRYPGLSGHAPLLRWDLSVLLARKCNQDDYDVLVMEDPARLTRADGAGRLEALFMLCGVQIVYVATWHADGAALTHRMAQTRRKLTRADSDRPGLLPDEAQIERSK